MAIERIYSTGSYLKQQYYPLDLVPEKRDNILFTSAGAATNYSAWQDGVIAGTGSTTEASFGDGVAVAVTDANAAHRVRQTKRKFYARNCRVEITGAMPTPWASVLTQRIGMFDANFGIFLDNTDSILSLKIRVSGTDIKTVNQTDWNINTLNGDSNSTSGTFLDVSNYFTLVLDWADTNRVKVGFKFKGTTYWAHEFFLEGQEFSGTPISLWRIPIRHEVLTTSATGNEQYCIIGNCIIYGQSQAQSRSKVGYHSPSKVALITSATTNNVLGTLSLQSTTVQEIVTLSNLSIIGKSTGDSMFIWKIVENPTITGTLTSASLSEDYLAAFNYNNNATVTCTGGLVIASGVATNVANVDLNLFIASNTTSSGSNTYAIVVSPLTDGDYYCGYTLDQF